MKPNNLALQVVAKALRLTTDELRPEDHIHSIPEWDSLAQLKIVAEIEHISEVTVDNEEAFTQLTTIGGIMNFLKENDVKKDEC
jgi:acyl carrier protein